MDKYNAESVHTRIDYVRYIYRNDLYPKNFDSLPFPIAVYGGDGVIAGANKSFREIAGITADDISQGRANLFDCLNSDNAALVEAAHNAFDGKERVYQGIGHALRTKTKTAANVLSNYPNAIFFPIACDREGVIHGAVLLDCKETENPDSL